jgi:hypothetical protein
MKKPLFTVLIANFVMLCSATAPVYSLSVGGVNVLGFAVIMGSMAAMNLVAGAGLSFFEVAEGYYFKWFGRVFFVLSIATFLIRLQLN